MGAGTRTLRWLCRLHACRTLGVLVWALERAVRDKFCYAFAAGGAYAFWAIAGVFLQGRSALDWTIEGILAALPLLLLWFKPKSIMTATICLLVFLLEFAITVLSLAFARVGTQPHKVLATHASLKAIVLASLVVGLVKLMRERRRPANDHGRELV